jgi:heme exporter protein CcmD
MIDFGKHAFHIWLSYGGSVALIGGLLVQSVLASRAAKARLQEAEDER